MKLYSFFNSSASYRVRIALELKKLNYVIQDVNIRIGEEEQHGYCAMNPLALVPTLSDIPEGSFGQSLAIIDYLDHKYPEPLLIPKEARERAQALEISYAIVCEIHPLNNIRVLRYLINELNITKEQQKSWYDHWITEGLSAVEKLLEKSKSRQYCVNDQISLADCMLIPQWANAQRMGCNLEHYPRCQSVVEHCLQEPAFIAAAPENQPDYID